MRSKFDEQLRLLNQEMMYMGTMIEDSIQKAIEALIAQNAQLAEKIMNSDSDVDHEQKKIENICFNLLMQQQPVARDLRVISAAMKMVTDMERIGDHAADISEITIMLSKEPYVLNLDDIKKMASETVIMLIRSIEAYVEKDMNKAQEVIRHDDIVDDLFDKNKADIIELIRHDPEKGEQAADMLMVAKYFDKIMLEEMKKEDFFTAEADEIEEIKDKVQINYYIEKSLSGKVNVTEDEVKNFHEMNKESFLNFTIADAYTQIYNFLFQQKIKPGIKRSLE